MPPERDPVRRRISAMFEQPAVRAALTLISAAGLLALYPDEMIKALIGAILMWMMMRQLR